MRIVGGIYKGRKLFEFKGYEVRPTSDMTRESLFNILNAKIAGKSFLDLFCGTGAMGIEALSRGASKVYFNDKARDSLAILRKNLDKLKVEENYSVSNLDAITMLKASSEKFDIIFVDPPYKIDMGEEVINNCKGKLSENGFIVLEDEKPFDKDIEGFIKFDQRKYGRVHLTFFREEK